jgi:hypothetical protein
MNEEPTPEREKELVGIYQLHLGGTADLGEYHDFDNLIECPETDEDYVSFEEWEWMRDNYDGIITVQLQRKTNLDR